MRWRFECQLDRENVKSTPSRLSQFFEGWPLFYIERIVFLMKTIMFNSIQVTNYWFTLHRALRSLYQQAQTFSSNIWGISDQDVTSYQLYLSQSYSSWSYSSSVNYECSVTPIQTNQQETWDRTSEQKSNCNVCQFCTEWGHHQRICSHLLKLIEAEKIHLNKRLCIV